MKRIKHIYQKIYDFENILEAYKKARKNKRFKEEVLLFTENLEENLIEIQNELVWETYTVGKYRKFFIHEPTKRLIMALPFKDRVVQWAVYRLLYMYLDKRYIHDSYACRDGKGTIRAVLRAQELMRQAERCGDVYILKMDVAKYFYRVDHKVAMEIYERIIADRKVLKLLGLIINAEECFGLDLNNIDYNNMLKDVGMPIGNLTSQMTANIYLNEIDQYAKQVLKVKKYIRYMDDIIIISNSKHTLWKYKEKIEEFLKINLRLQLNSKTRIQTTNQGLDFCGYRIWIDHIRIRKQTALRAKRRIKKLRKLYSIGKITKTDLNNTVASYLGLMQHADCYNLKKTIIKIIQEGEETDDNNQKPFCR